MKQTTSIEGGCLCSAVRYRIGGPPLHSSTCHCRTCRKASGAPAVGWLTVRLGDFRFTRGTPQEFASSANVVRTFCGSCGSPLTYDNAAESGTIDVTITTLDSPERFAPDREIWLEHKLSWQGVNAALPQFQRSSIHDPEADA